MQCKIFIEFEYSSIQYSKMYKIKKKSLCIYTIREANFNVSHQIAKNDFLAFYTRIFFLNKNTFYVHLDDLRKKIDTLILNAHSKGTADF